MDTTIHKPRLWTKDFVINSMINLIIFMVYFFLIVTIALYAADKLNASPSEAGLASGLFVLGMLVARLFVGRLIDQVGRKKILYFGMFFYLFSTFLYFGVNSVLTLFIVRLLHGIGCGIAAQATATIVASIVPPARRGEGITYFATSSTLAAAIGPFLGMILIRQGTFNLIIILALILLALTIIAVFFLKVPEVDLSEEQLAKLKGVNFHNTFESTAIPISIVAMFMGLVFSVILTFLNSYSLEIRLAETGSYFFIAYSFSVFFSRLLTGRLFDQKGENSVMYPAFFLYSIGLVVLSQAHHGFSLLLAGVIIGLGHGTVIPVGQAIAIKICPRNRMGLATSTYFMFLDAGVGMGPYLLGFLVPLTGLRGMYLTSAAIILACSFLYYFLHGRKKIVLDIHPGK